MHRLVQFVDSYDPPIKGLHEDLNFVSPRIGEVMLMSFSIAVVITVKGSIVISPSLGFGVILLYSIYSPLGPLSIRTDQFTSPILTWYQLRV